MTKGKANKREILDNLGSSIISKNYFLREKAQIIVIKS